MSFNLLEMLQSQVTGGIAKQAAGFMGESEGGVTKALGAAFPAILGSVLDKGSSEEGAGELMDLMKGQDTGFMDNISGLFGGEGGGMDALLGSGGGMLQSLMGDKLGGVVSLISKVSGMGDGATGNILKMAAPLLMGVLGKQVMKTGLNAGGLMDMLAGQKDHLAKAMPSGLGDMLGLGSILSGVGNLVGGAADAGSKVVGGVVDAGSKVIGGAADLGGKAVGATADAGAKVVGSAVDTGAKVVGGAVDAGSKVVGGAVDLGGKAVGAAASVGSAAVGTAAKTGSSLLKWLIPVVIVLALLSYFFGFKTGCNAVDNVTDSAVNVTEGVVSGAGDLAKDAANATVDGVKTVGNAAVDGAKAAGDAAGNVTKTVVGAFGDLFSKVDEAGKKALDAMTFTTGSAADQFNKFISGGANGTGVFQFKNLNFATGSATIDAASKKEVDNIAAIMKAYPNVKIQIAGHTDKTGDTANNMSLSHARAESVKGILIAQGIDIARLSAHGYGSAQPVSETATNAENRRIEVRILK